MKQQLPFHSKSNSCNSFGNIHVCSSCLLALSQSPHARVEKLSATFCLLLKSCSRKVISHLQSLSCKYYESDPPRVSTSSDIGCKTQGAPEIRRSRSVIAVTGLSTGAPFPLSHMDHLGDLFMEAIAASGPEHIRAIHALFCLKKVNL